MIVGNQGLDACGRSRPGWRRVSGSALRMGGCLTCQEADLSGRGGPAIDDLGGFWPSARLDLQMRFPMQDMLGRVGFLYALSLALFEAGLAWLASVCPTFAWANRRGNQSNSFDPMSIQHKLRQLRRLKGNKLPKSQESCGQPEAGLHQSCDTCQHSGFGWLFTHVQPSSKAELLAFRVAMIVCKPRRDHNLTSSWRPMPKAGCLTTLESWRT